MKTAFSDYLHVLTALFVIVNPIGAIPLFISFTQGQDAAQRGRTAHIAALAVALVLIAGIFVGDYLLSFFGIGIPAFRVAGGILILLMAIAMLNAAPGGARHTTEELREAQLSDSVAVVPLAIPVLAGPGALSTVIIYAHRASGVWDYLALVVSALLVALSVGVALHLADPIATRLGRTGINIATRLMGLILAAVAVEFIAGGLRQLFPRLG